MPNDYSSEEAYIIILNIRGVIVKRSYFKGGKFQMLGVWLPNNHSLGGMDTNYRY